MNEAKLFYLIRLKKFDKPFYQFSQLIPTMDGKYVPKYPEIYHSLSIIFQYLRRSFGKEEVVLVTMGFPVQEKKSIWNEMQAKIKKKSIWNGLQNEKDGPRQLLSEVRD